MSRKSIDADLLRAVHSGCLEETIELLKCFGLSNLPAWPEGYLFLLKALENEHTEIAELLLTNGCMVNSEFIEPNETTPLHVAVIKGQIKVVGMLLDRKAEIDARDKNQRTPLMKAIESGTSEYTQTGRNVDCRIENELSQVYSKTRIGIIKILVSRGADVNARDSNRVTPLELAIYNREMKIIELLLDNHADPIVKNGSNNLIIQRLIENPEPTSAGDDRIVELLLNHGADPNTCDADGNTALHYVVKSDNLRLIQIYIDNHADINARNNINQTPLHIAVINMLATDEMEFPIEIIRFILRLGANPKLYDNKGITPVHLLLKCEETHRFPRNLAEHCRLFDYFINHGAGLNDFVTVKLYNITSLCYAIHQRCNPKFLEYLLSKGADVNGRSPSVIHPLHLAVGAGDEAIVKVLLDHGATLDAENIDPRLTNILKLAVRSRSPTIVQQILTTCYANSNSITYRVTMELHSSGAKRFTDRLRSWLKVRVSNNDGITENQYRTTLNNFLRDSFTYDSTFDSDGEQRRDNTDNIEAEIVKLLLSNRINIDFIDGRNQLTMLSYAIIYHDVEMTKLCLAGQTTVSIDAFEFAALMGRKNIFDILIEHDPNVNFSDDRFLRTIQNSLEEKQVVLPFIDESDLSVDYEGKDHIARLLANKGIFMHERECYKTLLHFAALKNRPNLAECVLKIITGFSDESDRNVNGNAICTAANFNHFDVIKILLKYDIINVDATNDSEQTALYVACVKGYADIVKYLLDYGACLGVAYLRFYVHPDGRPYVRELIEHHILRMIGLNEGSSRRHEREIDNHILWRLLSVDFVKKCKEEGARMRNENIGNSNVCFYDIFENKIDRFRMYARNKSIRQAWESRDLVQEFPVHYKLMNNNFLKGQSKLALLNSGVKIFRSIHRYEFMPEVVIDHLFSYLDDKDLENLTEAGVHCDMQK